jgi:hypothetical protein
VNCIFKAFYDGCEIRYIGLANIHVIRESWNKLRALCGSYSSSQGENWLLSLHQTEWLQHVQHMLDGSVVTAKYLDSSKRSCVTHCRFDVCLFILFCFLKPRQKQRRLGSNELSVFSCSANVGSVLPHFARISSPDS